MKNTFSIFLAVLNQYLDHNVMAQEVLPDKCYDYIWEYDQGIAYLEKVGKDYADQDFQLQDRNDGLVWVLQNGEYVFCPGGGRWSNREKKAFIIFRNKACYDSVVTTENWPLENDPMTVWENHSKFFPGLKNGDISPFIEILESKYKKISISINPNDLEILRKTIFKKRKPDELDLLCYYLLVGEYYRKREKLDWGLLKLYGSYNYYYIPMLVKKEANLITFDHLYSHLIAASRYLWTLEEILFTKVSLEFLSDPFFHKTDDGFIYYRDTKDLDFSKLPPNLNSAIGWDKDD